MVYVVNSIYEILDFQENKLQNISRHYKCLIKILPVLFALFLIHHQPNFLNATNNS